MTPASGFIDAADFQPSGAYDVCIIGSGAGGAVVAQTLAAAGLHVIVLEEGGHHTKAEFKMREDQAFPMLYQEAGLRSTKDLSIALLQGRAVGGSTVINWTTCFRTPPHVLDHWRKVHGISGFGIADLNPHWDAIEERLNILQIPLSETNRNNRLLYDGCKALGMQVDTTRRNTRNCFKSGYCGMGCPVDAKQSMLVTYLPDATEKGALVVARCRVDRLTSAAGRIASAECSVIGPDGYATTGQKFSVRANRFVLSAGAIGTPAILIRSGLGGGVVGTRTFLHPVVGTAAKHKDPVEPFYGAPQSVASHALAERGEKTGLFFEAAPLHPMMCALASSGFGPEHRLAMTWLPEMSAHIVLAIDGFGPDEVGGTVEVRPSGAPLVDYQIPPRIWDALKDGLRQLIRIDLAAGAELVMSGHDPSLEFRSEKDLVKLDHARFEANAIAVYSAHIMGGARMGDDPSHSVVRSSDLRHHTIANLHVVDGSIFPTSLGVNPQETIYGIAHLMGARFVQSWKS